MPSLCVLIPANANRQRWIRECSYCKACFTLVELVTFDWVHNLWWTIRQGREIFVKFELSHFENVSSYQRNHNGVCSTMNEDSSSGWHFFLSYLRKKLYLISEYDSPSIALLCYLNMKSFWIVGIGIKYHIIVEKHRGKSIAGPQHYLCATMKHVTPK